MLVSLSLAFCAASCVQSTGAISEVGPAACDEPAFMEMRDESDVDGDLDLDISSELPGGSGASELDGFCEAGDGFTYRLCVLLKGGPMPARLAFCVSQPRPDVRGRCRSHVFDSPVSWANWCYNEFVE